LLAEIINNGAIGLPQAAWNARMSQAEAAARLVTMAERGLPLRLVAEGDRQLLWNIAQAGPATGGVPQPPAPPEAFAARPDEVAARPEGVVLPPTSAVPPHEQAIAGAVPLGQPPFGTSSPATAVPAEPPGLELTDAAGSGTPAESTWGLPGSSAWIRSDEPEPEPKPESAAAAEPEMTQAYPPPPPFEQTPPFEPQPPFEQTPSFEQTPPVDQPPPLEQPPPAAQQPVVSHRSPEPERAPAASPTKRAMISGRPMESVVGLFGEHLDVSLQNVVDPADQILTDVGYRLESGERALLVQTAVGNRGPIDFESLPDLYLVLVSGEGTILQKAAMAVAGYPAHRVGVPAGTQVSGWTVFLVPAATEVAEVRWSIRPDLVNRTVRWGFGPA